MTNLKDIIYLSNEDYEILVNTGTVTIDGTTLTYDENNVYITPEKIVTTTEDGLMSAEDKVKLDTMEAELDNVDTSPVYIVGLFSDLTPKKFQEAVGITDSNYTGVFKVKELENRTTVYNFYYYHISTSYYCRAVSAENLVLLTVPSGGPNTSHFTIQETTVPQLINLNIITLSLDITHITNYKPSDIIRSLGKQTLIGTAEFLCCDGDRNFLCTLYHAYNSSNYLLTVFNLSYDASDLFTIYNYTSSGFSSTFTLFKALHAPDISSSSSSKDDTNTLALKSDTTILPTTFTEITTLQGLIDIADEVVIDDTYCRIVIRSPKKVKIYLAYSDTNWHFEFDDETYDQGDLERIDVEIYNVYVFPYFEKGPTSLTFANFSYSDSCNNISNDDKYIWSSFNILDTNELSTNKIKFRIALNKCFASIGSEV